MRDIALDPATGDLELTEGRARLTDPTTGENVAQRLRVRLRLWRGGYVLDRRVGIPFRRFLGEKGPGVVAAAEDAFRRAVATCPGVGVVNSFSFVLGADRRANVAFEVTTTTGAIVADSAFIAEG